MTALENGGAGEFTATDGAIRIAITAVPDHVSLHVCDTGVGIRPEEHQAIFEPFVQAGPSRSGVFRGTGLGLTISRQLARAMGGDLTVESIPGEGSTFTLSLPRAATDHR